jgi:hypothetical protein
VELAQVEQQALSLFEIFDILATCGGRRFAPTPVAARRQGGMFGRGRVSDRSAAIAATDRVLKVAS